MIVWGRDGGGGADGEGADASAGVGGGWVVVVVVVVVVRYICGCSCDCAAERLVSFGAMVNTRDKQQSLNCICVTFWSIRSKLSKPAWRLDAPLDTLTLTTVVFSRSRGPSSPFTRDIMVAETRKGLSGTTWGGETEEG